MKLVYGVKDKPKFGQLLIFAFQQLLAIMAATIVVPILVSSSAGLAAEDFMSTSAALFGAGVGTLVYQLFTKFRSPVFLGSSFAFIGSMVAAFAGAISNVYLGYLGLIIGAAFAGLVYVIIAVIVKFAGVGWINKLMPAAVIGPTVALIGLSLAGAAIKDVFSYGPVDGNGSYIMGTSAWVSFICAMVTLVVVVLCSTYGKKMTKLIPFIIGILAGY
ncbi:MAG: uracil-xanthine permease, partial [Clostridia bacterium]|nr:uracil-xanthine permease [Clostridia bacterium]